MREGVSGKEGGECGGVFSGGVGRGGICMMEFSLLKA